MNPRRMLLATVLSAAFLAACAGDAVGPLGNGGDGPGTWCLGGIREGLPAALGVWALENKSAVTVTVQSVSLPNAQGLSHAKAWLIPIEGHTLLGGAAGMPSSPLWSQRRPAAGTVIPAHQSLNLVEVVARTADTGTAGGPVVTYASAQGSYTLNESTGLKLAAGNC